MLYFVEAGERDLRVPKRYAPVTSTRQHASLSESLKHELYEKFLRKKKKIPTAKIWARVHRNLVLEACMVAANAMWQIVFRRLLRHLMTCQEASGYKIYMHPATDLVRCKFPSAQPESDVVCVCGTCGSKRGIRINGYHLRGKLSTVGLQRVSRPSPISNPVLHRVENSGARERVRGNLMWGPSTDPWILIQVPFLWFVLQRQRTVKVGVMSATTIAYNQ